ncbi:MAG: NADP-dependent oxidoreductase [Rhodospirillales bacterium]
MPETNRRIVLARRPVGEPAETDFALESAPAPTPRDGQVLCRVAWLSLDPYMRGRMNDAKSYAPSVALGATMVGTAVGRVVDSRDPGFAPGDWVFGPTGWQDYAALPGRALRKLDASRAPVTTALHVLGMPGHTAYAGLTEIGRPKPGETVVVAAAAGAVGSVVGQLAKAAGCRAVGIAGGADKCAFVTDALGFDACVDRRGPDFPAALAAACPGGIDVYFENVGGAVFEAVLPLLNPFARVPLCGLISSYNLAAPPPGPDRAPAMLRTLLTNRITIRGFIVIDFEHLRPAFEAHAAALIAQGRLRWREDIVEGLENAPRGLIGLLRGENFGKRIVRVAAAA